MRSCPRRTDGVPIWGNSIQSKEDENYNIYILQRQFIDRSSSRMTITELWGLCSVEYKTFDQQEQEAAFKLHHHSAYEVTCKRSHVYIYNNINIIGRKLRRAVQSQTTIDRDLLLLIRR